MRTFTFSGIPPHCVKSTRDRDLFADPDEKYAVVDVRMDVEKLVAVRVSEPYPDGEVDTDDFEDSFEESDLDEIDAPERTKRTKISLGPNPRAQNLRSVVAKKVRASLLARDGRFHRLNRGILIVTDDVRYDNQTGELFWTETDQERHGCVDGGHTLRIIEAVVGTDEWKQVAKMRTVRPQFVSISFIRGVKEADDEADIADARNTSMNVEDYAIANLRAKFDFVGRALEKYPAVDDLIAYKQFEVKQPGKEIDIVQVLQCLTVLDNRLWQGDKDQPYRAYWSRKKTVAEFLMAGHTENYQRLSKLVPDALALREYIIARYKDWYGQTSGKTGTKPAFGRTNECKSVDQHTVFHILPLVHKSGPKSVPYTLATEAVAMPILGALRAVVSQDDQADWVVEDIYAFVDSIGPALVDALNAAFRDKKTANAVLKDKNVWRTLYLQAKLAAYEDDLIDRDVPKPNGSRSGSKSAKKATQRAAGASRR